MINLKMNSLIDKLVIINTADTTQEELETKILTALENATVKMKEILESSSEIVSPPSVAHSK